jgi:hypothetical protein
LAHYCSLRPGSKDVWAPQEPILRFLKLELQRQRCDRPERFFNVEENNLFTKCYSSRCKFLQLWRCNSRSCRIVSRYQRSSGPNCSGTWAAQMSTEVAFEPLKIVYRHNATTVLDWLDFRQETLYLSQKS